MLGTTYHALRPTHAPRGMSGDHKKCVHRGGRAVSTVSTWSCVAPWGILPLVLVAAYPATSVEKRDDGTVWRLTSKIHGVPETRDYHAPSPEVAHLLDLIRRHMDTEFGGPAPERQTIVETRRRAVLELMRLLDRPAGEPLPMRPVSDETDGFQPTGARRPGHGLFSADAFDFSFLGEAFSNDLTAFGL